MPQFIRLRPEYKCHESEQKVAALLRSLPAHWIVVWGYYYKGPKGVVREGDFLVLDPDKRFSFAEIMNHPFFTTEGTNRKYRSKNFFLIKFIYI